MTRQQDNEHLFHHRPADWDEKYGPWGTPPDYTPPMTATNNIQSPLGLRIAGVVAAIFAIAGIVFWYFLATTGVPITGNMFFCFFIIIGLGVYMTWWCFHLAKRRATWLREKNSKLDQHESTEGRP